MNDVLKKHPGIFLSGNWKSGWSIDLHTVSSSKIDDNNFNTKRTILGELLYQYKYRNNQSVYNELVDHIYNFTKNLMVIPYISAIIPVPPSDLSRKYQPTLELAKGLSQKINKQLLYKYLTKIKRTEELKSTTDPQQRKKILDNAFKVNYNWMMGKKVLLFDDLYRSGSTLNEITKILYKHGKVQNVYVLTITKTRSKY
tara:strand:- start:271 stop:867 length:597 start_codon:yes stop_codon:yes gene_type:complete